MTNNPRPLKKREARYIPLGQKYNDEDLRIIGAAADATTNGNVSKFILEAALEKARKLKTEVI